MTSKSPHHLLHLETSSPPSLCTKLVPTLTCFVPIFNPATVLHSYIPNSTNFWPTTFSNQIYSTAPSAQDVFDNGLAEFQSMSDSILESFLPMHDDVLSTRTNMTEFSPSEYIQVFPTKPASKYPWKDNICHFRQFCITPTSSLPPISAVSPQIYRTVNPTGAFEQLIIPTGLKALHKDGIEYSIAQTTYPNESILPIVPPACSHRALQLNLFQSSLKICPQPPNSPLPISLPSIEFPSLLNNTFINVFPQSYSFAPPDISFIQSVQSSSTATSTSSIDSSSSPPSDNSTFHQFCFPKIHSFETLFGAKIPHFFHFTSLNSANKNSIYPDFFIPFSIIYVDLLSQHSIFSFYLATLHLQTWRNTQLAFFPTKIHHNHINSTFPSHNTSTKTSKLDTVTAPNDDRLKIILIVSNAEMMDQNMLLSPNQIMELGEECDIDFLIQYQPTHSPYQTKTAGNNDITTPTTKITTTTTTTTTLTGNRNQVSPSHQSTIQFSQPSPSNLCPIYYQSAVQLSQFIKQTMLDLYLEHHHTYNPQSPIHGSFNDELCVETCSIFAQQRQDGISHLSRNYDQSLSIPPKFSPTRPLYYKMIRLYQTHAQGALQPQIILAALTTATTTTTAITTTSSPTSIQSLCTNSNNSSPSAKMDDHNQLYTSNAQLLVKHNISIHELTLPIICVQKKFHSQPPDNLIPHHSKDASRYPLRHVFEHFLIQQPLQQPIQPPTTHLGSKPQPPLSTLVSPSSSTPHSLGPIFSPSEKIIPFHRGIGLFHAREYEVSQCALQLDVLPTTRVDEMNHFISQNQPLASSLSQSSLISPTITRYRSQNDQLSVQTDCYRIDRPTHLHHLSLRTPHRSFSHSFEPVAVSIHQSLLPYNTIIQSHASILSSSASSTITIDPIDAPESDKLTYHHVLLDQYPSWYFPFLHPNPFLLPSLSPQSIPAIVVIYHGLPLDGALLPQLRLLDPCRFKNMPVFLIFITPPSLLPHRNSKKISNSSITLPGSQNDGLHTLTTKKSSYKLKVIQTQDVPGFAGIVFQRKQKGATNPSSLHTTRIDKDYLTWFCTYHQSHLVSIHRSFHFLRRVEIISFLAIILNDNSNAESTGNNDLLELIESTDPMEFATTAASYVTSIIQLLPIFNKLIFQLESNLVQLSKEFHHKCILFDSFYVKYQRDVENAHKQAIIQPHQKNLEYFQKYYCLTTDPYRLHSEVPTLLSPPALQEYSTLFSSYSVAESKLSLMKNKIKCIQRWIDLANKYVDNLSKLPILPYISIDTIHDDQRFFKTYDPMSQNSPPTSYKLYSYVISEHELFDTLQRVRELALVDYFTNYSAIWGPMM